MANRKKAVACLVVALVLLACIPAFASSGLKTISVLYDNIKVTLNGVEVKTDAEPFQYNGTTFVPIRLVSQITGANIVWNDKTKTIEIVQPILSNNIINQSDDKKQDLNIEYAGFYNQGTKTYYTVYFSDKFMVSLTVPKGKTPNLLEYVIVSIYTDKMDDDVKINTPNIVGFSELTNQKFYPLDFSVYSQDIPESLVSEFKGTDFYKNFESNKSKGFIAGAVYFDSYPFLDGIYYDDGVHKCTLYLEDKER